VNQTRTARDRLDRALSVAGRTRRFVAPALAVFMVGALASVGYAMVRKRVFRSETLILVREGARAAEVGTEVAGDRAHRLALRLKELVLSRSRLETIIKESNLYPSLVEDAGMIDAVDEMRRHIAFRVQDGDTFGLSFEGEDPKRVQQVTVKLAEAIIAENSHSAPAPAGQTKDLLEREKARTAGELKDKEAALAGFVTKHPEFARESANAVARAAAPRPAPSANAKNDPALASLEREAQRLEERLGVPSKKGKPQEAQADPSLAAAKQAADAEAAQAQKELTEKLSEFTEEHPDVRAAKAKLKLAQDKQKRVTDSYNTSLAVARQREAAKEEDEGYIDRGALENQLKRINEEIVEYKRRRANAIETSSRQIANTVVALETEWTRLNRDAANVRERLQSLEDESLKASMVEVATPATSSGTQMIVIDPAFLPTHAAKPGRTVIGLAGGAVALVLALALALGLAIVDDRLYDRVDIERLGLLPLLGVVPGESKVKRG